MPKTTFRRSTGGDGHVGEAPPVPPNTKRQTANSQHRATIFGKELTGRELRTLDWIHYMFLFYSGAHNFFNAWARAESLLFFVFVLVGILSVELMLWTIYANWKSGRLVGKMLRLGMYAGVLAMFYATAGILAQAQVEATSGWLATYYQWILPSSAPVMFIFAFLIQAVDPIMTAERDLRAYAHLLKVEAQRDKLDHKRLDLNYRKDVRRLKAHIHRQKLIAMAKESNSRRTRSMLKRAMEIEMPRYLKEIGVPVDKLRPKRASFLPWRNGYYPTYVNGSGSESEDPGDPSFG